jgi:hypothetical protein
LHGVADGEAEPEEACLGQRKVGQAAVEQVRGRVVASVQSEDVRPGNRDSQRRRTLVGKQFGPQRTQSPASTSAVISCSDRVDEDTFVEYDGVGGLCPCRRRGDVAR